MKQIACGYEHLLILTGELVILIYWMCISTEGSGDATEHGLLLGAGINTDGQLGTSDDLDRHMPSPVKLPARVTQIGITSLDAGADTSSFITSDGMLYTFGNSVR